MAISQPAPAVQSPTALELSDAPAICVSERATVAELLKALRQAPAGGVAIVGAQQCLRGTFSEREALHGLLDGSLDQSATVSEVVPEKRLRLRSDAPRRHVLAALLHTGLAHIPVCDPDSGEVVGMVSASSVLRHEVERLRDELEAMEHFLSADGPGG